MLEKDGSLPEIGAGFMQEIISKYDENDPFLNEIEAGLMQGILTK